MFLLNLGLGEFLVLFGAVSGIAVALYLLDRSRRRVVVATLRFWKPAEHPPDIRRRRRIQQPVSLLLQLLGMLLLLLAIAQLRLGAREGASRDHILILDTSAWMAARSRQGILMEVAQAYARAWLRALPPSDRVMLVRADTVATPATALETNRRAVDEAILQSKPGSAALHLGQAFEFARQMRRLHARRAGEVVYAGAGRITELEKSELPPTPADLRILPVESPADNCGLRKISLRRSAADPGLWEVFVSVRNYGAVRRTLPLSILFGGAPMGSTRLTLAPESEQHARFEFRTRAAGWLEVRLLSQDALPGDDRALLELPQEKPVEVVVYSSEPGALRPLLATNPWIHATYRTPAQYDARKQAREGILILDRFAPQPPPETDTIWIQPPRESSPIAVANVVPEASLTVWRNDHPVGRGLRTRDLKLEQAEVFVTGPESVVIGRTDAGAVLVVREGKPKMVVFGFHPGKAALRYELATPLLFANIVQWMAPEALRRREIIGASVGSVTVELDGEVDPSQIRVLGEDGRALPFTVHERNLRFFGGAAGIVRVITGDQEMVYSLSLPEVAEAKWEAPKGVRRGVPPRQSFAPSSRDIWQWLAILGGLCLALEWAVYGRARAVLTRKRVPIRWPRFPSHLFRKAS